MPRTQRKPQAATSDGPLEVLNLTETAAYLRIAERDVLELIRDQGLPARRVGAEWRFLKAAIQDWLRTGPARPGKQAQLSLAGTWKDDPYWQQELNETYRNRGRPMTEAAP